MFLFVGVEPSPHTAHVARLSRWLRQIAVFCNCPVPKTYEEMYDRVIYSNTTNDRRKSMSVRRILHLGLAILIGAGVLSASTPRRQKALWIEATENGELKTTIAVTEEIARLFLESKEVTFNSSEKGKDDLITKQMLLSVLNGEEEMVKASDKNGEAKVYMKKLDVPSKGGDNSRLVIETYESGDRKFRIALPEVEIEHDAAEGNSHSYVGLMLGWRALLPFLAKEGGAVYIHDHQKDTEVWIYTE